MKYSFNLLVPMSVKHSEVCYRFSRCHGFYRDHVDFSSSSQWRILQKMSLLMVSFIQVRAARGGVRDDTYAGRAESCTLPMDPPFQCLPLSSSLSATIVLIIIISKIDIHVICLLTAQRMKSENKIS